MVSDREFWPVLAKAALFSPNTSWEASTIGKEYVPPPLGDRCVTIIGGEAGTVPFGPSDQVASAPPCPSGITRPGPVEDPLSDLVLLVIITTPPAPHTHVSWVKLVAA